MATALACLCERPTPLLFESGCYRVRLAPAVVQKAATLARHRAPLETGGMLLGVVVEGEALVLAVTGPGRRVARGRVAFQADREHDNRLLRRVYPRLRYLGDWHTHPGGPAELSRTDVASVRESLSPRQPEVLHMLLAGPAGMDEGVRVALFTAVRGEADVRRMAEGSR